MCQEMKKYLLFFKNSFEEVLVYRANLAFGFFLKLITFLAFIFIWRQIASEGNEIEGYGLDGIILYYLLTQTIDSVYSSNCARLLREDILSGNLSGRLVRPFSKIFYYFAKQVAQVIVEGFIHIILTLPVLIVLPDIFMNLDISLSSVLLFIISIIMAMIFSFSLFFSIGIISFWTKQSGGLQMVVKNAARILTGDLIPLDLLPFTFRRFVLFTPFAYILYFPIKIIMGGISNAEIVRSFIIVIIWISIFNFLNLVLWKKGLKKYEAVGI